MKIEQKNTQSMPALLCNDCGVDAQETKSLCCEAAGIIDPVSATAEALIPHEKLREAASVDAALIAQERPPAQPVVGYKPLSQPDERAEYEKEFPAPEGLQYCANRDTYIRAAGSSPSDKFAREHYAYRAGFAAWMRRAWKQATTCVVEAQSEGIRVWGHKTAPSNAPSNAITTPGIVSLLMSAQTQSMLAIQPAAWLDPVSGRACKTQSGRYREPLYTGTDTRDLVRTLDTLAWVLAEGVAAFKADHPGDAWFSEAEIALEVVRQRLAGNLSLTNDPADAAIQFAIELPSPYDGMDFLRYWNERDFDSVRESWPEVPEEVLIGADPLYRPGTEREAELRVTAKHQADHNRRVNE